MNSLLAATLTAAPAVIGPRNRNDEASCAPDSALGPNVTPEFRWQAQRMPSVSRALLLSRDDPSGAEPEDLMSELQLEETTATDVRSALASDADEALLQSDGVLPPEACLRLRHAVDTESQAKADTVDGAPDHQLNLSHEQLEAIIGAEAAEALWRLPAAFLGDDAARAILLPTGGGGSDADETESLPALPPKPQIFVRRYTPCERPWNPFHTDSAALTINVALDAAGSHVGGELLGCYSGRVRVIERAEGTATVHASTLLHGVCQLISGVRHALIIFVGLAPPSLPVDLVLDDAARLAEADALAALMADEKILSRCAVVLGGEPPVRASALREQYSRVLAVVAERHIGEARRHHAVGKIIEGLVQHYAAPHLRPTSVLERMSRAADEADAACWSLRALLSYAADMAEELAAPHPAAVSVS